MKSGYVQITDTTTGEARTLPLPDEGLWNTTTEFPHYIWEDGNYSCNCNRELFFWRAGGEEDKLADEDSGICSGDDRYTVKIVIDCNTVFCDNKEDK